MKSYNKIGNNIGTHTCCLTLMERDYVGHITFNIGGNCRGASILETALEYLEDPAKLESDCRFKCYDDGSIYSVVLSNGETTCCYPDMDYDELSDMIVAVEIIDYKDSGRTTLFEEETNESLYKV